MSDITQFKCPSCGGIVEFDSQSQKMKCPYCDSCWSMSEFEILQKKEEEQKSGWHSKNDSQWLPGETDAMRIYVCESCGGEIIVDENTGATSCPFCGNRVVVKSQFEDDLRPDFVIPFQLDKKDAKNAYLNHLKGKRFLPKCFKSQNHIDEIKRLYVPFWIYDVESDARANFRAERVQSWRSGNTQYTKTSFYAVERGANLVFEHIPIDSSKKMDDVLMESIEPFDFKGAVDFKTAYLAGYLADRYDVDVELAKERVIDRVEQSAKIVLQNSVKGYDSIHCLDCNVRVEDAKFWYTLYPVWILNTSWHGKNYIFAMNGQTGKMTGDLPCDSKAFWLSTLGLGSILSLVVVLVTYLFF